MTTICTSANRRTANANGRATCALLLASLLVPADAAAQELDAKAQACVDAYHASQELRLEQKIRAAREKATVCAQETCPNAVRSGCTKWLTDLAVSQPSLAITARGADGTDVTDVVVEVDGQRVTDSLSGRPIEVDPGKHVIRFSHRGLVTTQEVVVTEGIKNRPVEVQFADPSKPEATTTPQPRELPVAPLVIGGVGVVSLGVFATLAALGTSEVNDLRDNCAPGCSTDEVDSAKQKILLGDVFLGTGVVAVGISAVWLIAHFTSNAPPPRASTGAIRWSIAPTVGGGFASVSVAR
jgi:hypothetical protein